MGAPKCMGGPQRVWVGIKRCSNYLRRGSVRLQKDCKGLKKGGEILRCCEVFKGRGVRKRKEKKTRMERYIYVSVL